MAGALNIFKTVTANISTTPTSVYTPPIGYATVVLLAQISNIDTANTVQVTANLARTAPDVSTVLVGNISIPVDDAINVLTGRLIMNFGDSFEISATANASSQLTLSLLETLVG
jgi:hypothetical protein